MEALYQLSYSPERCRQDTGIGGISVHVVTIEQPSSRPSVGARAAGPLSPEEIDSYWADGYLFVEHAITPEQLEALVADFDAWVEESREHHEPYGDTLAGRPRFDLAPEHTAKAPRLRRVASPVEVSDNYLAVVRDNRALDAVAQLIGPNVEFNNSKIKRQAARGVHRGQVPPGLLVPASQQRRPHRRPVLPRWT